MFSGMTTDNFWFGLLRMYVVPYLAPSITKFKSVRKKLYRFVSQINIAYLSSSLSRGSAGKIRAGMRLPYFMVAGERGSISVFTLVNQSSAPFSVLLFNISQAPALQEDLFHLIVLSDQSDNKKNFKKMGLPDSFVIVVRPDNYIAYISTSADGDDITRFMKEAYHLQTV